ncbi:hypothetical protein IEO21_03899 [Rhodonia placenta]|uniref:Uncharacterized protein n=1 Tax=Rhodonia placenta TaxID=104341 RepID=A0A8H7P4U7_9APHY|nr:hypothetical protein IEO21_03899 [Postia placenta]
MVRPFPNEIWLDIFYGLAKEGEYDVLERCRVVCKDFELMARECLQLNMRFKNVEEVERIKVDVPGGRSLRRWGGPQRVYILGGNQEDGCRPIPHLATFASRLAGRWPRIEELSITDAVWRARDLDLDTIVRDLAASTITKLRVINIILPSILTFGCLLCALPHLKKLTLCDVQFTQHPLVAGSISRLHLLPRTQLKTLYLTDGRDDSELRPSFVELVDLMAAVSNRRCLVPSPNLAQVSPWNAVRSLTLDHVTFPSVTTFARLLCALPALKSLKLEDLYAFVKHGFDLTSVPVLPGLPLHLADVDLGNNLRSDPCSVADLVDFFIATGLSEDLRRITACLSSSPRVTTVCDAALDRLVKHSQSLRHLSLHQSSFGHVLSDTDEWRVDHSAAPYFDVSCNTYLERLDLTVDIDQEHIPHLCAPVLEILSQVTSAHISRIQVNFWPCYLLGVKFDVDLGELMDGLPQLDVMFSRPIFNNLTDVIIHIRTLDRRNVRDKELAHSLQLCLPMLDARGILSLSSMGLDWDEETGEWRSHRIERVSAQDAVVTDAGADADNDRRQPVCVSPAVYADAQTPSSSNSTDAQVPADSACDDGLILQNATAGSVYPWINLRQTITVRLPVGPCRRRSSDADLRTSRYG